MTNCAMMIASTTALHNEANASEICQSCGICASELGLDALQIHLKLPRFNKAMAWSVQQSSLFVMFLQDAKYMFATASIYVNAAPSSKTELSAQFLHKLQTCQKTILLHARARLWMVNA